MGISITCPTCGHSESAPESARGEQVSCDCGTSIVIGDEVPELTTLCTTCGIDLTYLRKKTDNAGRSYCDECWTAHRQQSAPAPAAKKTARKVSADPKPGLAAVADEPLWLDTPAPSSGPRVACPACGASVPQNEMTVDSLGEPLCSSCFHERNAVFDFAPSSAPEVTVAPPTSYQQPISYARPTQSSGSAYRPTPSGASSGSGIGQMVIGGLMFVAGVGFTFGSYGLASSGQNGGKYYVFYGLAAGGAVQFFRGLGLIKR